MKSRQEIESYRNVLRNQRRKAFDASLKAHGTNIKEYFQSIAATYSRQIDILNWVLKSNKKRK